MDGAERQAGQIVFDRADGDGPVALARELLAAASPALKGLFCP
jgi:hypothetical protein